ncbi:Na+-translocating ferredoxin:NAD+ oxidoreductase RNF, RnfC subunit [Geosporobacter subterraneus DSM 17957]|uniref:Na+-translocating ferredoxin:NAD+ oxidoreductase RNF, RnfC subunit n=1 Tax=Geosporobacter subterraneus DSM 17957 TaxID=1121919 RepID=A0A1M6LP76_9FIRM|nr:SLBB domain-containing protein [Geosporobacter subterraneus]SHJ72998.1 Na+-translocating ferredoxin:NAD+ oxidoreductase RNF, RnfC subunit [Geosporobacter subterraneus DSM 17957]
MDKDLVSIAREAGVVGAGGAGFPTHVKINAKVDYILVNGAECEPLLRVDQQLLAVKTKEVLEALNLLVLSTSAQKGVIALKGKYKDAIKQLNVQIGAYEKLAILPLDNFYPAGDEQVTVYEVFNRIVPEGGIPLDVGVIVINVETLLNLYEALAGKPVTEKYLTITGAVKNPKTIKAPIGISILEAIALAGGPTVESYQVIDGGPMMGKVINDLHGPITKTTKGLILLPEEHSLLKSKSRDIQSMLRNARTSCMHCSLCTEVCPRNLLGHTLNPDRLMRLASYNSTCSTETKAAEAFLCCECALCEYACVMDLQPWKLHRFLKGELGKAGIRNPNNKRPQKTHPFREYKKFPVKKLVSKLGLNQYDVDAPLEETAPVEANRVSILLKQHIGAPATPTVQKGDSVRKGQLIADLPEGKLGAKIHATIDGVVETLNTDKIVIRRG